MSIQALLKPCVWWARSIKIDPYRYPSLVMIISRSDCTHTYTYVYIYRNGDPVVEYLPLIGGINIPMMIAVGSQKKNHTSPSIWVYK